MSVQEWMGQQFGVLHERIEEVRRVQAATQAEVMEYARGIKYMRLAVTLTAASSQSLPGPDQGYAWDLKLVSVKLSASDSLAVYVADGTSGDAASARLIGYAAAPGAAPAQPVAVVTWSSHQVVMFPGEGLFVATSGTGNITRAMVAAVQVPAEMLGKILG